MSTRIYQQSPVTNGQLVYFEHKGELCTGTVQDVNASLDVLLIRITSVPAGSSQVVGSDVEVHHTNLRASPTVEQQPTKPLENL